MKVSLEWIGDYVELPSDITPRQVAHDLTLKTVEVEEVIDTAAPLAHIVAAVVEEVRTTGSRTWVTGHVADDRRVAVATTVAGLSVGQTIAIALPGARLAAGSTEIEVQVVKVGGRRSGGVVGTPANLRLQRLFPDADPTRALDLSALGPAGGTPLAEVIGFTDIVLEIDNKSLTNRPDLWGHAGIARELAVIYDRPLRPVPVGATPPAGTDLVGEVDPTICHRLSAMSFDVDNPAQAAPLWLRSRLARIGEGTLGLIVDLTNYVMFSIGQPTHAYDADKLTGPLRAVPARAGGKLALLDGGIVDLAQGTPVISDATGPVALAGIMGGADSAITPTTRRVVLEAATFRPQPVRRSSQRAGVRTEASARFEKALDTQRVDAAIGLFSQLLHQLAPGAMLHQRQDIILEPTAGAAVTVDSSFLAERIGTALDPGEIGHTLTGLGFTVQSRAGSLRVLAPTWRSTGDISVAHDIVEEIARIHGYDNLPTAPLSVQLTPARSLGQRGVERQVREALALRLGLQEVITYPWVTDAGLATTGLAKEQTVRFEGAPAPDRGSLRPSLIPNLIDAAVANLRYTTDVAIFEVGTTFHTGPATAWGDGFEPMPPQTTRAAVLITGADGATLFRRAAGLLQQVARLGQLSAVRVAAGDTAPWADASARACVYTGSTPIGTVGLLTKRTRRLAGLAAPRVVALEIDLGLVAVLPSRDNTYHPIPDTPGAEFDLSLVVADSVPWAAVESSARHADPLVTAVGFIDEFRGSWVPAGHRSLTLRITARSTSATLSGEAISGCRESVLRALAQATGAHLRK